MASDTQTQLRGLLECPLRSSYIEFEYAPGDKAGELRKRIQDLWQIPKQKNYGLFRPLNAWAILCKDLSGTYSRLADSDSLPVETPDAIGELKRNPAESAEYWWGKAIERKVNGFLFTSSLRVEPDYPRETFGPHDTGRFKLNVVRGYNRPEKDYNVELVALALITGG